MEIKLEYDLLEGFVLCFFIYFFKVLNSSILLLSYILCMIFLKFYVNNLFINVLVCLLVKVLYYLKFFIFK